MQTFQNIFLPSQIVRSTKRWSPLLGFFQVTKSTIHKGSFWRQLCRPRERQKFCPMASTLWRCFRTTFQGTFLPYEFTASHVDLSLDSKDNNQLKLGSNPYSYLRLWQLRKGISLPSQVLKGTTRKLLTFSAQWHDISLWTNTNWPQTSVGQERIIWMHGALSTNKTPPLLRAPVYRTDLGHPSSEWLQWCTWPASRTQLNKKAYLPLSVGL